MRLKGVGKVIPRSRLRFMLTHVFTRPYENSLACSFLRRCSPPRLAPRNDPIQHLSLVGNVGSKTIDEFNYWRNHRQGPVCRGRLQLFPEVRNSPKDLFMVDGDSRTFIRLQRVVVRRFDNPILGTTMLHNAGETMFDRSQPGETFQACRKLMP